MRFLRRMDGQLIGDWFVCGIILSGAVIDWSGGAKHENDCNFGRSCHSTAIWVFAGVFY